jgi:hypothetical protein
MAGEPLGWKKALENALMVLFSIQIYYCDKPLALGGFKAAGGFGGRVAASQS